MGVKLAAIGPATADELRSRGLCPDHVPPRYVAETIVAGLGNVRGERILLPRADIARPALVDLLCQGGAEVIEVTAYHTLRPEMDASELGDILAGVTVATFTSSSTIRNLAAMAGQTSLNLAQALERTTIACIGPITAQTARELDLTVHVMAQEYTIDGLVEALIQHFSRKDIL